MVESEEMWLWMMSWCKKEGLSPADNNIWDMAKAAYHKREEKE